MKSFLETWLSEAPGIFQRELSAGAELCVAEQLPAPASAISLAVTVKGARAGRFAILTDREELHSLFVVAKVTESNPDSRQDSELWRGLLHQVAQAVAAAIGEVQVASVAETSWTLGIPAAAYQLRLGSVAMRMAFADQTQSAAAAVAETPARQNTAETPTGNPRGSVDLLLDVELEASLRFGSREMSLNEVLELGPGDVVELDRHVADPVDLLVGDKIVARGEVVLVNGNFGFSVLEVAQPEKRLESIRCLF